jgi:hypothetical protein
LNYSLRLAIVFRANDALGPQRPVRESLPERDASTFSMVKN